MRSPLPTLVVALVAASACSATPRAPLATETDRAAMLRLLEARGVRDTVTLRAMSRVPREAFVRADDRRLAYGDFALPIAKGQTISQPYVVAVMTEAIRPRPGMKVLEVGTGSGYQAAVLAEAGCKVFTIEIFRALADSARARLARLGYRGVEVKHGDGYAGWPSEAPFDAIVVTCGADETPPALVHQLAPRGRLVIPVGPAEDQELLLLEKDAAGKVRRRSLFPVRFVPMLEGLR
jgi:protein-L-isoaspartate(D-aspartate) O-methyltransferase